MAFTSSVFLFFFLPLFFLILLPVLKWGGETGRKLYLALSGVLFFLWANVKMLPFLAAFIGLNFLFAKWIEKSDRQSGRRTALVLGVLCNVAALVYFKYANYFIEEWNRFLGASVPLIRVIVPLGVSFLVFEAISLLMDVYRKQTEAGSLLDVAVFFTFFPKLVSGPIIRYQDFKKQLHTPVKADFEGFAQGLQQFIVGLSKKLLIADVLGVTADLIYEHAELGAAAPAALWLGAFCYMLQIYFDFSGYSDSAIGLSKCAGFDFAPNFEYPYTSLSVTEFWRRWHISLGSWFREYLYIPLGGNRRGNVYFNLFFVFLATGVWHGAGMSFFLWGLVNAFFVVLERAIRTTAFYKRIPSAVKWLATTAIVYFSWIFFRSGAASTAIRMILTMLGVLKVEAPGFTVAYYMSPKLALVLAVGAFLSLAPRFLMPRLLEKRSVCTVAVQRVLTLVLLLLCVFMVYNSTYSPFIYAQF